MNSATTARQLSPSSTDCPSWCTRDHDDDDLQLGYVHTGDQYGYQLGVPDEIPVELRFQLRQFTDTEATDATFVVFNDDTYDETALRLLAAICLTQADLLRAAQSDEEGR